MGGRAARSPATLLGETLGEQLDRWLLVVLAVVVLSSLLPTFVHLYRHNREEVHARIRSRGSAGRLDAGGRPGRAAPVEGRLTVEGGPTMTALRRDDAWQLLCEWTQGENLRRHGLAVEAAVAWYGEHRFGASGAELERWRMAGLLHDFDYERYPESHPLRGAEELRRLGYPEEVVEAVLGHGDHTGQPRTSQLAHAVYACDEMSGFVTAVALVRPSSASTRCRSRRCARR